MDDQHARCGMDVFARPDGSKSPADLLEEHLMARGSDDPHLETFRTILAEFPPKGEIERLTAERDQARRMAGEQWQGRLACLAQMRWDSDREAELIADLAQAREKIEELEEMIACAGPLHWVAHQDTVGAGEWERDALALLQRSESHPAAAEQPEHPPLLCGDCDRDCKVRAHGVFYDLTCQIDPPFTERMGRVER